MKFKLFFFIVSIQVVIVISLSFKIHLKRKSALGISVNTIDMSKINMQRSNGLYYFYEPKANSIGITKETWLPYEVKNTINNDALNERFDYNIQKNEGVFRIITLGDSFTYGENVSTDNNWTELLEDYLNKNMLCKKITKYEVINLGMKGYDTQYEVERYKIRGQKYQPDIVLWLFTDYERILEEMMPLIKQNDTIENRDLEKKGIFFNNWKIARKEMLENLGKEGVKKYQIKQIKQIDKYFLGKLLLITFPDNQEYIELVKHRVDSRPYTFFFQPNIDFEEKKLFLPDHHFNVNGHKKMMREVAGYLTKNKLIPCSP